MTDLLIQSNMRGTRGVTELNSPSLTLLLSAETAVGSTAATNFANGDFLFKVAGLTVETVQIMGSTDGGTTWSAALLPLTDSTLMPVATGDLPNGQYRLPFVQYAGFTIFKFVKSNNAEDIIVAFTFPQFTTAG